MLKTARRIDPILEELGKRGAVDLHLAVNQPPLARVHGELVPLRDAAIPARDLEDMLLELLSASQRTLLADELDVEFSFEAKDIGHVRASYFVKHSGIAAAFRVIAARPPSFAELGAPEALVRLADRRSGLVVIGGPAGNGKTALAAAFVDQINRTRACHVVTLERPIEFVHEPERAQITQREIGTHVATYTEALRSVRRENPDVVVVGDPREGRDIETALRLAADGALVVLGVTASSVVSVVDGIVRSVDALEQRRIRALLADVLAGIVVQHLVRGTDSTRRIPVHDVLVPNERSAKLLREGSSELVRQMRADGTPTLDAGLERLLAAAKITPEAAFERALDKEPFAKALRAVEA